MTPLSTDADASESTKADSNSQHPLDVLRRHGIQAWAIGGWIAVLLLLGYNILLNAEDALPLAFIGGLLNVAPTSVALRGRHDAHARLLMGTLAAALPALLVFLLKGHPWQMDAHMYFFVALAALVFLADWRPIALATGLIAVHHLLLEWIAPTLVFAGEGNLGRVVFHVVAVALQFGALTVLTLQLERLFDSQQATLGNARALTSVAEERRRQMEQAMQQANAAEEIAARERARREADTARLASERRGELVTLANEFERSVKAMVRSISAATASLEKAAIRLERSTGTTTREADDVATSAGDAASEIAEVARSVRDLAQSIQAVGATADQQSTLTEQASREARSGVETIGKLEEHAISIESFLDTIHDIATKTNLLALNAAIEAARAGEAGHGFGVVAGEVKTLAGEARRASDRIRTLLHSVRDGISTTGEKLRSVNGAIADVSAAASGIALAVNDQSSTARKLDDGAGRVVRSASNVRECVSSVAKEAGEASSLSRSVRVSAADLAASADNLGLATDQFISFLRADSALVPTV